MAINIHLQVLKNICLFSWLQWVLVAACRIFIAACRIFSYSMWNLVPWLGIEPNPPVLGAWSLSHWTTREVPIPIFLKVFIKYLSCINYENNLGIWSTMLLGSRNSKHAFFSDHWDLVKVNYVCIGGFDEQIKAMGPLGILEGKVWQRPPPQSKETFTYCLLCANNWAKK